MRHSKQNQVKHQDTRPTWSRGHVVQRQAEHIVSYEPRLTQRLQHERLGESVRRILISLTEATNQKRVVQGWPEHRRRVILTNHALLEVTNILFSTSTNFHPNLLMCSSDKSMKLSQ